MSFSHIHLSLSLDIFPGVKQLGQFSAVLALSILTSRVTALAYTPTSSAVGYLLLHIVPAGVVITFLNAYP